MNIDKIKELLQSNDLEIRKLIQNYIYENYKLNFYIYRGIDKDTNKYVYGLDSLKFKDADPLDRVTAKTLLDCMTEYPYLYNSNEIYSLINLIMDYDRKFR